MAKIYTTQNELLLKNLLEYYEEEPTLNKMLNIINGESSISLRIVDWFVTNYAKKNFTVYNLRSIFQGQESRGRIQFLLQVNEQFKILKYSHKARSTF